MPLICLYNHDALTMPLGMQYSVTQCLSQRRINWQGSSRKGIRHKNGGDTRGKGTGDPHGTHTRMHVNTHTQPFYGPFSGTTRVSRCQKKSSSELYRAREDIRGRQTDNPAGRHSIQTDQRPTSFIPHFYTGCPSCCNPPDLSWLGTGTKYAGLHTQWLGCFFFVFNLTTC